MRVGTGYFVGSCLTLVVLTATAFADASLDHAGANAEPARAPANMTTPAAYAENIATGAPRNLFHNPAVSEPDFASSAVFFKTLRNRTKTATNLKARDTKILH